MRVRTEDYLSVGEVAIARNITWSPGEQLLILLLEAALAVAVPVDETEQVGRQRGARVSAGQIGALGLLLQPDARQLQCTEAVGLRLGDAPRDVRELDLRLEDRRHRCVVGAEDGGQGTSHALPLARRDLVRRDEGGVDRGVDDELGQVAVEDRTAERRQRNELAVLGLSRKGELAMFRDLPVGEARPDHPGEDHGDGEHRDDAQARGTNTFNLAGAL